MTRLGLGNRRSRVAVVALTGVLLASWPAWAQLPFLGPIVVHDPAVTLRNSVTAMIEEWLLDLHRDKRTQIDQMARRISAVTDVRKFAIEETPEWRIHDFWTDAVLFAHDYHAALNYGDNGSAYKNIVEPVMPLDSEAAPVSATAWPTLRARLASIETADALAIAATNDAGLLRFNGRREQESIEALQAHVIDPSQEQSATAVLEKMSGAALIAARQRQARVQFVAGIVEQLLVDTKRARDTDATALNMQLTTWREAGTVNAALAAGVGDALRNWRQP
jgi:hypothetical protein